MLLIGYSNRRSLISKPFVHRHLRSAKAVHIISRTLLYARAIQTTASKLLGKGKMVRLIGRRSPFPHLMWWTPMHRIASPQDWINALSVPQNHTCWLSPSWSDSTELMVQCPVSTRLGQPAPFPPHFSWQISSMHYLFHCQDIMMWNTLVYLLLTLLETEPALSLFIDSQRSTVIATHTLPSKTRHWRYDQEPGFRLSILAA